MTKCLILVFAAVIQVGCAIAGPASISNGHRVYNRVINTTEDEQLLSYIVRERYDETAGMLTISSVTASLRVAGSVGADFGFGPSRSFDGNLVPLSAGVAYEENPTVSFVPLRGEQFLRRMLTPVSIDQAMLLSRADAADTEPLRLVVRRINGLTNPMFAASADAQAFDDALSLYTSLRNRGLLDLIQTPDGGYGVQLKEHRSDGEAGRFLAVLGISTEDGPSDKPIRLPIDASTGSQDASGIDLETPSAFEVLQLAGDGIDIPEEHARQGIVRRNTHPNDTAGFITIRSARARPDRAPVAVEHRGWWFYIDATDARSKRGFILLRTLVGMRLHAPPDTSAAPVLTLPVGG